MRRCKLTTPARRDAQSRSPEDAHRRAGARTALGTGFGTADRVEQSLSDLQWVTLWAQIYSAEMVERFGVQRD